MYVLIYFYIYVYVNVDSNMYIKSNIKNSGGMVGTLKNLAV